MATKSVRPAAGDWQIARQPERDPFFRLHREMARLFDDMLRGLGPPAERPAMDALSVDISKTDGALQTCADLPGVDEKDLDVSRGRDMLAIRGERKAEGGEEQHGYRVMERSCGGFIGSFRLLFAADPDKAEAVLKNGALTIAVPKPLEAQQRERRIARAGRNRRIAASAELGPDAAAAAGHTCRWQHRNIEKKMAARCALWRAQ